ncbi:MAG: hypothetical protein H0W84_11855, partial [Bacteroidetes bacterium]|nr:hypothetical protein [Bacteroidota bacterium]
MPLAIGNYWIYQSVTIDTNGVETIYPKQDSLYVLKDTVVNASVYYYLCGASFFNFPQQNYFYRDSSGFIVSIEGKIIFAPNYYRDTAITVQANYDFQYRYMIPTDTLITVPAGTFLTSTRQWKFVFTSSYSWDKVR